MIHMQYALYTAISISYITISKSVSIIMMTHTIFLIVNIHPIISLPYAVTLLSIAYDTHTIWLYTAISISYITVIKTVSITHTIFLIVNVHHIISLPYAVTISVVDDAHTIWLYTAISISRVLHVTYYIMSWISCLWCTMILTNTYTSLVPIHSPYTAIRFCIKPLLRAH